MSIHSIKEIRLYFFHKFFIILKAAMKSSLFRTIRGHLFLLVLISIFPALGVIVYSGFERSLRDIEQARADAMRLVETLADEHERAVASTRQFLMTLAKVPEVRDLDAEASNRLLGELLKQNPLYGTLFILDARGNLLASGLPISKPANLAFRKYFQDAARTKDLSVGEYAVCQAVRRPVLHLSYPLVDAGGILKGAVCVSLDIARYANLFPDEKPFQGSTLSFSDHKGILLYRYPGKEDNTPKPDLPDIIKRMSEEAGEGIFTYTGADGRKYLNAYKKFSIHEKEMPYAFIRVSIPEDEALAYSRKMLAVNLLLIGLAFVIAALTAWYLGNAMLVKRLDKLVLASVRIGRGDLSARTGLDHTRDELGALAMAFDTMAERIERMGSEGERAEERLKKTADEWRTTFDSITDHITIVDSSFRIVRGNRAAADFYDLEAGALSGASCYALTHGTEKYIDSCPVKKMYDTGLHEEVEHYCERQGKWLLISADPIVDAVGRITGAVHIVKDISDRKLSEEALRMESIGTLAGGIAHDFNNILMAILGYASIILMDMDAGNSHYEKLKIIEEQVQSGADLARQLLGFARGGKYEIKTIDLNDLLASSAEKFGRTKKEISIYRKHEKDLWTVEADRVQLEQVFLNLFMNAWQAMPGGGDIYLETRNTTFDDIRPALPSLRPGRYVCVSITDTGAGMDEATRQRIFEPFFTTKEMGRGKGLGLAAAYGVVKNHGGTIQAFSEKGKGATLTVYLPASEKQIADAKSSTGKSAVHDDIILFVDDQDSVLNVGRSLLETLGYRVLLTKSGKEAIETYGNHRSRIILVILDMVMPVMGGVETFKALKEINPEVKVILSSGYSMNGDAAKILEHGCSGFIQKPFSISELSKKINEVLG